MDYRFVVSFSTHPKKLSQLKTTTCVATAWNHCCETGLETIAVSLGLEDWDLAQV